ncbi:MAG: tetratricopeptide repeat protein [Chloroflexi bacterium]|nr:tetratricopeptide repeat protein [Chloroflexota bacterium]
MDTTIAIAGAVVSVLTVIGTVIVAVRRLLDQMQQDREEVHKGQVALQTEIADLRKAERVEQKDLWAVHHNLYETRTRATHEALGREEDGDRKDLLSTRFRDAEDAYLGLLDRAVSRPETFDPSLLTNPRFLELLKGELKDSVPEGPIIEAKEATSEERARVLEILKRLRRLEEIAPGGETAEEINSRGDGYFFAGEYEQALQAYDEALSLEPDSARSHLNRGAALSRLGRLEEALTALGRERNEESQAELAARLRAAQDEYLDLLDRAVKFPEVIDPSLRENPEYVDFLRGRLEDAVPVGPLTVAKEVSSEQREDLKELLTRLERLEETAPGKETAEEINKRGDAYYFAGDYKQALQAYDDALRMEPNSAIIQFHKGAALSRLGRFEEALEALDRSIMLAPGDAAALNYRGFTLDGLGRYKEAVEAFDRAIELRPGYATAHANRAESLTHLGRHKEALQAFERAAELEPNSADNHHRRGRGLDRLRHFDEAVEAYEKALSLQPDHQAVYSLAVSLAHAAREEDARAVYERALKREQQDDSDYYHRARMLAVFANGEQALVDLRRSVKADTYWRAVARTEPDFDNIRDDPRFVEIVGEESDAKS